MPPRTFAASVTTRSESVYCICEISQRGTHVKEGVVRLLIPSGVEVSHTAGQVGRVAVSRLGIGVVHRDTVVVTERSGFHTVNQNFLP
jgi:hypothetical protein